MSVRWVPEYNTNFHLNDFYLILSFLYKSSLLHNSEDWGKDVKILTHIYRKVGNMIGRERKWSTVPSL